MLVEMIMYGRKLDGGVHSREPRFIFGSIILKQGDLCQLIMTHGIHLHCTLQRVAYCFGFPV